MPTIDLGTQLLVDAKGYDLINVPSEAFVDPSEAFVDGLMEGAEIPPPKHKGYPRIQRRGGKLRTGHGSIPRASPGTVAGRRRP